MLSGAIDFADLFAKGIDHFLACVHGAQPEVVGDHRAIGELLSMESLETVIACSPDRDDSAGAYGAKVVDGEVVTYPLESPDTGLRSTSAVQRALGEGFTIVANRIDQLHPAVSALAASAEAHLQQRANVNLYLTPPRAIGFSAHHDSHDVFIAQVSGSKRWRLWRPEINLPIRSDRAPRASVDPQGPPDLDIMLRAGQVLYLPRGWIHEGIAGSELSLHLTIGMLPITWAEVLTHHIAILTDDCEALRATVPFHAHGPAAPELGAMLSTLLGQVNQATGPSEATHTLRDLCRSRLQRRNAAIDPGSLMAFVGRDDPDATTWLERRPGLTPVVTVDDEGATITFAGGHVTGPAAAAAALDFVAMTNHFRPEDLPALPPAAQLALARQLVFDGLVRPADPQPTP